MRRYCLSVIGCGLLLVAGASLAQPTPEAPRKAFRVCQDPNNMPLSNTKGEGLENKIAEVFAKKLGLPVAYYSFPNRMAFVRNTLRYKLPGEDYPCDVIMTMPQGADGVATTKPYYRSTYALVYAKGRGLDDVKSSGDFLALSPERMKPMRIGVYDRSPASNWLAVHGLENQGRPYALLSADPEQYPGEIIEKDLAGGKIDAAVVWGPIAGYYAKKNTGAEMVVIPLKSQPPRVRFDFPMAMGVRFGEPKWKAQIEQLIDDSKPEIEAILREFGIPLVDENGESIAVRP